MTTGERLKRLRKERGLSADELGALIGKDRSTIYRYERGDLKNATIDVIPMLARALQTTPQYILGWDKRPAFYWVDPAQLMKLSEITEHWFGWTREHAWTEKEFELFTAHIQYILKIKDTPTYQQDMEFLFEFYKRLK